MKREFILATVLLAVGLFLLPVAVYWVGQQVVGPYEAETGLLGLLEHLLSDFIALEPGAWLLICSPYAIVQLLRFALHAKRSRHDVTDVTDSH